MTREDFSNGFDTLLNSYALIANAESTDNPITIELDEYEKSLFLTQAQETFVLSLYNGKNPFREGFEHTEELRRYLAPLVKVAELLPITTSNGKPLGVESNSKFFSLPEDLWFITYEQVAISDSDCESLSKIEVYPVRQDEYQKLRKNPFRGANARRALRLDLGDNTVEIVSSKTVSSYYVRYLKKLTPIILIDLSDGLEIEGKSSAMDCILPDILHRKILELAVQMAIQSRTYIKNNENR